MITYTTEILYHFQCDECKKWWSIGDYEPGQYLWCPWCIEYGLPEPKKVNE